MSIITSLDNNITHYLILTIVINFIFLLGVSITLLFARDDIYIRNKLTLYLFKLTKIFVKLISIFIIYKIIYSYSNI